MLDDKVHIHWQQLEQRLREQPCQWLMKLICLLNNVFSLTWIKIIKGSLTSRFFLTFCKNSLFSRFSMNPVSRKYEIWRCLVSDMER